MEKVELAKLPPSIPLQIVVDYWPRYVQMDVWNLIPQTEKRLRIVNCAVSAGNLTYLENMKDLKELIIVSDGNPPLKEWDQLSPYPIRWIANNSVPSQASLEAFTLTERRGLEKNLVLDHDAKLTASEKTRISESALPIEWTHAAP